MLHSVYFRSLVDLENKSCVRVPLVIILPECELNHCCQDSLKKTLQMVCEKFHSNNFHKAFQGLFLRNENIQTLHQALWQYVIKCSEPFIWPSDNFWRIFGNLWKVCRKLQKIVHFHIKRYQVEYSKRNSISTRTHVLSSVYFSKPKE